MIMITVVGRTRTIVEHTTVTFTTNDNGRWVEQDAKTAAQSSDEWQSVEETATYEVLHTREKKR